MIRSFIAILALCMGSLASADTINTVVAAGLQQALSTQVEAMGLNFKEGDQASFKLAIGGIINGTMVETVKSVTADSLVITQDVDLGFAGKQNCENTLDPNTGKVKSITCNGQHQAPPDGDGGVEVIDTKEDTITVPAGTFTCLYVKAKLKKDDSVVEQWINPKLVPVGGLIKIIAPTQMGPMNVELTSFKKN